MKGWFVREDQIKRSSVLAAILTVAIGFFIDIKFSPERGFWLLYILPITLSAWKLKNKYYLYAIYAICSFLILLVFFIVPSPVSNYNTFINRIFGILVLSILVILLGQRKKAVETVMEREKQLQVMFSNVLEKVEEKKKIESLLIESEKKFRAITESMPQIVWTATPDGKIDYSNSQGMDYVGIASKDIKSFNWLKYVHPKDLRAVRNSWRHSLHTIITFEITFRFRRYDGEYRWFLTRAVPVFDSSEKISRWLGTSTDIHHQKEMQQKLSETLLRLMENEDKLLEVQRITHVGSYLIDYKKNINDWSEEVYNILKINSSDFCLTLERYFSFIHPDDFEYIKKEWHEAETEKKQLNLEHRVCLKDDSIKYLQLIAKPVLNDNGEIIKIIGAIVDITERKNIHLELEETLNNLSRSNKELEQFGYTVSHDLQEPIRMIKGYSQLLLDKYNNIFDTKASEFMNFILEGASRMQVLVSDLLKYSRITSKTKSVEDVDCNEIVTDVLTDLKIAVAECDAEIQYNKLPTVKGEPTLLRQLFQNLIQNAIKFRNLNKPEIKIMCQKRKNEYHFSVKDNGIGIKQDSHERIFEIFQRLHERSQYSGSGVGLAVCKKIVEIHNGKIWVESEPGRGSTFHFTIPHIKKVSE